MKQCPACGSDINDGDIKCLKCGAPCSGNISMEEGFIRPVLIKVPGGFNFGAFIFGGIWAFAHGLWIHGIIGLFLFCIPVFNLIYALYLGFFGNRLAWMKSGRKNVELFKRNQRKWSWAGVLFLCIIAFLITKIIFHILPGDRDRYEVCADRMKSVQQAEKDYYKDHGTYTDNMALLEYYLIPDCNNKNGCGGKLTRALLKSCSSVDIQLLDNKGNKDFLVKGKANDRRSCSICISSDKYTPASFRRCGDGKSVAQRCSEIKMK